MAGILIQQTKARSATPFRHIEMFGGEALRAFSEVFVIFAPSHFVP
jgi:hypothetical protein